MAATKLSFGQALVRQRERLCADCLYSQTFTRFRAGLRAGGVVRPGDRLALAFSGGSASAAALHFFAAMRSEAGARPERSKTAFTLTVVHVAEGAAAGLAPADAAAAADAVRAAAARYCISPAVRWVCVPLEDVFCEEGEEGPAAGSDRLDDGSSEAEQWQQRGGSGEAAERRRARLARLLAAVVDPTGREDLVAYLRARLLLRTAARLGCSKVARGECAGRLAGAAVAAAAKGRGYALPGDVHMVDARRAPAVPACGLGAPLFFYPLRDIGSREVALVCHFLRLPVAPPPPPPAPAAGAGAARRPQQQRRSINALAERFVAGLQAHHPGTVPNILGTLAKLQAFPWNHPPELASQAAEKRRRNGALRLARGQQAGGAAAAPSQDEGRQQQGGKEGAGAGSTNGHAASKPERTVLCPLCYAPLADDELPAASSRSDDSSLSSSHTAAPAAALSFCLSCQTQILGSGSSEACVSSSGEAADDCSSSAVLELLPVEVRREAEELAAAGRQAAGEEGSAGVRSPAAWRAFAAGDAGEGLVLGIESSCDDTGVAVVTTDGRVLGESLATQADIHAAWGGVVPKLAQEAHEAAIDGCVEAALAAAGAAPADLSAVAVTVGPGLSLCLRVGVLKARALAAEHRLPLVPVHHMEAHALVARLGAARGGGPRFPFLCLLVSGGHNLLLLVEGVGRYIQLGTTLDDALGEAYDKVARLLGLDLVPCGGAALEALALRGDPRAVPFSVPLSRAPNCDFSYAGLKTAARLAIEAAGGPGADIQARARGDGLARADIAASFQRVAVAHLEQRLRRAAAWARESHPCVGQLVVAGGVASNAYVRAVLGAAAAEAGLEMVCPPPRLCTDNGVMVAWTGVERLALGLAEPPPAAAAPAEGEWVDLRPRWPLTDRKDPRAYSAPRSAKKKRVFPSLEALMAAQRVEREREQQGGHQRGHQGEQQEGQQGEQQAVEQQAGEQQAGQRQEREEREGQRQQREDRERRPRAGQQLDEGQTQRAGEPLQRGGALEQQHAAAAAL
eukprot:scaffold3.g6570.t1